MAARPGKAVSFFKLKIHLPYDQQSHSCVFTWEKWKCIFTKILAWGCSITARLHQVLKLESSSGARGRGTTGGTQRDNRPAEPSVRGEICQHTRRCGWVSEAGHKRCAHCGPFTKSPSVEKPTWRKNESGRHRIKGWFRGGGTLGTVWGTFWAKGMFRVFIGIHQTEQNAEDLSLSLYVNYTLIKNHFFSWAGSRYGDTISKIPGEVTIILLQRNSMNKLLET